MNKIWFILINGKKEGPYSLHDLKKDFRVTPNTLVWREGFTQWVPLREVPELKEIFEEEEEKKEDKKNFKNVRGQEVLCIEARKDPPLLWLVLILFMLFYFFYRLRNL